jgi:hypothetical protein
MTNNFFVSPNIARISRKQTLKTKTMQLEYFVSLTLLLIETPCMKSTTTKKFEHISATSFSLHCMFGSSKKLKFLTMQF